MIPPSECIHKRRGRATPSAKPSDLGENAGTGAQRSWLEATAVSRAKNKGKVKTKNPVGVRIYIGKDGSTTFTSRVGGPSILLSEASSQVLTQSSQQTT